MKNLNVTDPENYFLPEEGDFGYIRPQDDILIEAMRHVNQVHNRVVKLRNYIVLKGLCDPYNPKDKLNDALVSLIRYLREYDVNCQQSGVIEHIAQYDLNKIEKKIIAIEQQANKISLTSQGFSLRTLLNRLIYQLFPNYFRNNHNQFKQMVRSLPGLIGVTEQEIPLPPSNTNRRVSFSDSDSEKLVYKPKESVDKLLTRRRDSIGTDPDDVFIGPDSTRSSSTFNPKK